MKLTFLLMGTEKGLSETVPTMFYAEVGNLLNCAGLSFGSGPCTRF